MHCIQADCRRAVFSLGFFLAVLGIFAALVLGVLDDLTAAFKAEELLAYGCHRTLLKTALHSDALGLALPVLVALPYSGAFLDELREGTWKGSLHRTTRRGYLMGKGLGCWLSGALAPLLSAALFWVLGAFTFQEVAPKTGEVLPGVLPEIFLLGLSGGLFALSGMGMSLWTRSRYMAWAAPFLLYYGLYILCTRYFPKIYVANPATWRELSPWPGGAWGAGALVLALTLLFFGSFWLLGERRLEEP